MENLAERKNLYKQMQASHCPKKQGQEPQIPTAKEKSKQMFWASFRQPLAPVNVSPVLIQVRPQK